MYKNLKKYINDKKYSYHRVEMLTEYMSNNIKYLSIKNKNYPERKKFIYINLKIASKSKSKFFNFVIFITILSLHIIRPFILE